MGSRETLPGRCCLCGHTDGGVVLEGTDHRERVGGWFAVVACDGCGLARTEPVPVDPGAWYPSGYQQHDAPDTATTKVVRRAVTTAGRSHRHASHVVLATLVPDAAYLGDLPPGTRLLDVGAGNGNVVAGLRDVGVDAWGVEPSSAGAAIARSRGLDTVVQGTLEDALAGGAIAVSGWEVVRMYQVLEHVPDPLRTLGEIRGILGDGGRLIIGVPNLNSLARRAVGSAWDGLELPRHLTHFTPRTLRMVLERAGFGVKRMRTVALFGILPGSIDARTSGGTRQRGWGEALPVRALTYPLEIGYAALGQGDGIIAEAVVA